MKLDHNQIRELDNIDFLSGNWNAIFKTLVWFPIIATVVWALLAFNPSTFDLSMMAFTGLIGESREWSIVELLTALLFVLAVPVGIMAATAARKAGCRLEALVCLLIAAAAALIALEETQWGQPLIGFQIPETILKNNEQREFTLHNLEGVHGHAAKLFLVFCIGAIMLRLPKMPFFREEAWQKVRAPATLDPLLASIIAMTLLKLYIEVFDNPFSHGNPIRWLTEFTELSIAAYALYYVAQKRAGEELHA